MTCFVTTHGHTARVNGRQKRSPTYNTWRMMIERCYRSGEDGRAIHKWYHRYGGRGIRVCDEWQGPGGFVCFLQDMGERPEGKTLDRWPNRDGHYEKDNCRWATAKEQAQNKDY